MDRLRKLTQAITTSFTLPAENRQTYIEQMTTTLVSRRHARTTMEHTYTAVIVLRDFSQPVYLLTYLLTQWLEDNDPQRDTRGQTPPQLEVDITDHTKADISITFTTTETVAYTQTDDGVQYTIVDGEGGDELKEIARHDL